MKQFAQKLKNGEMKILEVPLPPLQPAHVLVRNHYSLISSGTEKSTIKAARKGYVGKAKERPEQLKQVVSSLKTQGLIPTYRAVMKKLDAYSPLGYSSVGEIVEMTDDVKNFRIGDFVACGGLTASHAEFVCVPVNLCVGLKPGTDLTQAVYNSLGSIAMQGIRQANIQLGETCAVIGLGLVGQLTALLLRAAGARVVGIDVDSHMVGVAGENCVDLAISRQDGSIENKIMQFTDGIGCDAVLITAASDSLDPINFAGAISRNKGIIVIVGSVPTGFNRDPYFYRKELQVRMSCSYGPGRYDNVYEEKGIDYPPGYVRWTENRNMQAFQELMYSKRIDIGYLTTHIFKLKNAPDAYDMILLKSEPFLGVLIEYETHKKLIRRKVDVNFDSASRDSGIGFIGAGSYAQGHLIPNLPKDKNVKLKGVMTASGTSSRSVAERFGFEFCTGDARDILDNENINTIFIATRHNMHASLVKDALKAGKHVFVEKPLCLCQEDLDDISDQYFQANIRNDKKVILMVGYNRRFSPLTQIIKKEIAEGPMAMIYRVNAGYISNESWIQDLETGGGRIIGEVGHFVDFLTYINGSLPTSVFAVSMNDSVYINNDVVNISLAFENGSIGSICYLANGNKRLSKERFEVYSAGKTAVLDDFRKVSIYSAGKTKNKKLLNQDKGQHNELKKIFDHILNGKGPVIPFEQIYNTSLVTFKIFESIKNGQRLDI